MAPGPTLGLQGPLGGAASPDCAVLAQPPMAVGRRRALAVLPGIAPSGHALADPAPGIAGSRVHRVGGSCVLCRLLGKRPLLSGNPRAFAQAPPCSSRTLKPQSFVFKLLQETSTFQQTLIIKPSISKPSGLHPQKQSFFQLLVTKCQPCSGYQAGPFECSSSQPSINAIPV